MKTLHIYQYHHIDRLDLITPPPPPDAEEIVYMFPCTAEDALEAFSRAGWDGDGHLGCIWLPPFLFADYNTEGKFIWHVKQSNHGTSWMCAGEALPFIGLEASVQIHL